MFRHEERNSVQDLKFNDNNILVGVDGANYDKDGNLIATEKIIYGLYKINLENLIVNKIYLSKEYHIAPSEIERMTFLEYEILLEQVNIIAKKQEEEQKKQQEDMDSMRSSMNPNKMMSSMGQQMKNFNTPSMPNMPKISVPKL